MGVIVDDLIERSLEETSGVGKKKFFLDSGWLGHVINNTT